MLFVHTDDSKGQAHKERDLTWNNNKLHACIHILTAWAKQGSDQRLGADLRDHPVLHRRGGDEPVGNIGHHAVPNHVRDDRVLLLRALHAVRHQPAAAPKVSSQRLAQSDFRCESRIEERKRNHQWYQWKGNVANQLTERPLNASTWSKFLPFLLS